MNPEKDKKLDQDKEKPADNSTEICGDDGETAGSCLESADCDLAEAVTRYVNSIEPVEESPHVAEPQALVVDGPKLPGRKSGRSHTLVNYRNFRKETEIQEKRRKGDHKAEKVGFDLFKAPVDNMFIGKFDDAKIAARFTNKWLLVDFHDPENFKSLVLNRDVWSNKEIKRLLEKYFVLWQANIQFEEGFKLKSFYRVPEVPFVAILDPRTGERVHSCTTFNKPSRFLEELRTFILNHPSYDRTYVLRKFKRSRSPGNMHASSAMKIMKMSEEEQIKLAIQNSLADIVDKRSDDDNPMDKLNKASSSSTPACTVESDCQVVPPSYDDDIQPNMVIPPGKTVITFMFPWGERHRVIWSMKTTMGEMLAYLKRYFPKLSETQITLKTSFPPRNLCKLSINTTLVDSKIHPSAVIHILMDED